MFQIVSYCFSMYAPQQLLQYSPSEDFQPFRQLKGPELLLTLRFTPPTTTARCERQKTPIARRFGGRRRKQRSLRNFAELLLAEKQHFRDVKDTRKLKLGSTSSMDCLAACMLQTESFKLGAHSNEEI